MQFFDKAAMQNHPLRIVETFLNKEKMIEQAKNYEEMRFVGYALDIGYEVVTIITSDPFKMAVGGVPRNSLLIMVPSNLDSLPIHFTLLRVLESAPTPLSSEVQQTYFELQKKSMPELDIFTQSELQWGALKTSVLGMFYPHPQNADTIEFSGDLNNFVSAHKYRVYSPNDELLNLIINSLVPKENRFEIGKLRLTECRLPLPNKPQPNVTVNISAKDIIGKRTAMFGKTRLGKSNVVKLIAQSIIEATTSTNNVGQLIFDISGEYANDNPWDNSSSLASAYSDRCEVYALTRKESTPSKPLKLNFYEQPDSTHRVLGGLLRQDGRDSTYIRTFAGMDLPSIEFIRSLPYSETNNKIRAIRKIQIYWAILKKAGYLANEAELLSMALSAGGKSRTRGFDPGFTDDLRENSYSASGITPTPTGPNTLDELVRELVVINRYRKNNPNLQTDSGNPLFDADDIGLLEFFDPAQGSGPGHIQPYRLYHDKNAGDFIKEILVLLDSGKTVILDLGNAHPDLLEYYSNRLSNAVFNYQVDKFSNNKLGNKFVQLYFEEAHNILPRKELPRDDPKEIYSRFAKEGAKYHIGMIYSTQSPTTINKDLLAQTENFFVAHISSHEEVDALARLNVAYESMKDDILRAKTTGYIRMLTQSHRFVVSVQANKFVPPNSKKGE
jgi:hypothetical protein